MFGLSLYTGENEIRDVFSKYGPIEHVAVVYDHQVICFVLLLFTDNCCTVR